MIRVAKLNFVESLHPQMLSYVECRSEAEKEQPKTLVDLLGEVAEVVVFMFAAVCAFVGFMVLMLLLGVPA